MAPPSPPEVEIRDLPAQTLIALPHTGPYDQIGVAFDRFVAWAVAAGVLGQQSQMAAIYYDEPSVTPPDSLRSAAGAIAPADMEIPAAPGLAIERIALPAGPYAVMIHRGPYETLKDSYAYFYGPWLAQSGRRPSARPAVEVYIDDPHSTPPAELRTEIRMALER